MYLQEKVGYACINLNTIPNVARTLRASSYNEDKWQGLVRENLDHLMKILSYNVKNQLPLFRISSEIIPLATHPVLTVLWPKVFALELMQIGDFIKSNQLRVSMHVSHFTVLNSPIEKVAKQAIQDIEYHALFLDSLGLDATHKIITHVGGVYQDKGNSMLRWLENYALLSENAKNRLVLENDEKHYGITEVLKLSQQCGVPVVYDYFHDTCYQTNEIDIPSTMDQVIATWKSTDGSPKIHYSQQDPSKRKGAHSKSIQAGEFLIFYQQIEDYHPDIMIEAKAKNIAGIKARNCILQQQWNHQKRNNHQQRYDSPSYNPTQVVNEEWARYKYVVMSYGYSYYKQVQKMVKDHCSILDLYLFIDVIMQLEKPDSAILNTLNHVWGYFKKNASISEKIRFHKLIQTPDQYSKARAMLEKLTEKYGVEYLIQSYYFHF